VTPTERPILGWCLQSGEVPACVRAVKPAAWSGPMALLLQVLNEWQAQGLSWAPTDLWEWVCGDGQARRLVCADEVLCAPLAAPWAVEEVEALCGEVVRTHRETAWWVALAHEIEVARVEARIEWVCRMAA
jgi:hypothetical protein